MNPIIAIAASIMLITSAYASPLSNVAREIAIAALSTPAPLTAAKAREQMEKDKGVRAKQHLEKNLRTWEDIIRYAVDDGLCLVEVGMDKVEMPAYTLSILQGRGFKVKETRETTFIQLFYGNKYQVSWCEGDKR